MKRKEPHMPRRAIIQKIDQICEILDGKVRSNPNEEVYNRLIEILDKYLAKLSTAD